jgi:succinate semialdehyde reductase (NADPH)
MQARWCNLKKEGSPTKKLNSASDSSLRVGDRVITTFIMPCGSCGCCNEGMEDICETFFALNRLKGTLYDGKSRLYDPDGNAIFMYSQAGLADYSVVPQTAV